MSDCISEYAEVSLRITPHDNVHFNSTSSNPLQAPADCFQLDGSCSQIVLQETQGLETGDLIKNSNKIFPCV